ncbi:MAG TPA: hypothetical protein VNS31_10115, partial [Ramlibacter sp.]|nr:hypothetical protein [Ramlibacter sp.]
MTVTVEERSNLIELMVGMFNASPGAQHLAELTSAYEATGGNIAQVASILSATAPFQALSPSSQSAVEFASFFLTPLGLQNDSVATDFVISQFNAGVNKGQIIYETLAALEQTTAAGYRDAQALLHNKVAVAYYHSVTQAQSDVNIAALQHVLAPVTKDAPSVLAAEAALPSTTITVEERSNLIELMVGMFNASPGAQHLAELTSAYEATGGNIAQVA